MKLSNKEVEKIAQLSRLKLTDEELEVFTSQLTDVLDYVNKLNELDTKGVPETSQVTGLENIYRADQVESCELAQELIEQSPETENNQIKVPNVL